MTFSSNHYDSQKQDFSGGPLFEDIYRISCHKWHTVHRVLIILSTVVVPFVVGYFFVRLPNPVKWSTEDLIIDTHRFTPSQYAGSRRFSIMTYIRELILHPTPLIEEKRKQIYEFKSNSWGCRLFFPLFTTIVKSNNERLIVPNIVPLYGQNDEVTLVYHFKNSLTNKVEDTLRTTK